jgi:hypothetical protein
MAVNLFKTNKIGYLYYVTQKFLLLNELKLKFDLFKYIKNLFESVREILKSFVA